MKQLPKILRYLVGALVLVALLLAASIAWCFYGFTHDDIQQSRGPISRARAAGKVGFPLPPGAHEVQYASFSSGLQVGEFFVRFEAPVVECEQTAAALFAEHAQEFSPQPTPIFRTGAHFPAPVSAHLSVEWFDTEKINHGRLAVRANAGWQQRIWIDDERGVFYFWSSI